MKQIKWKLERNGWTISLCQWQAKPFKGCMLESYTISRNNEVKTIILQEFKNGTAIIFEGSNDLLRPEPTAKKYIDTL